MADDENLDISKTIIGRFEGLQGEDGDMRYEQYSEELKNEYEKGSDELKKGMDNLSIRLCGYSIDTIIKEIDALK